MLDTVPGPEHMAMNISGRGLLGCTLFFFGDLIRTGSMRSDILPTMNSLLTFKVLGETLSNDSKSSYGLLVSHFLFYSSLWFVCSSLW